MPSLLTPQTYLQVDDKKKKNLPKMVCGYTAVTSLLDRLTQGEQKTKAIFSYILSGKVLIPHKTKPSAFLSG